MERLRAHTHGATERPTRFSHYLRLMVENAEVRWLCATAREEEEEEEEEDFKLFSRDRIPILDDSIKILLLEIATF